MIVAGQSLYTLEVQPAANAALAANEAEKAARINVIEIVSFGSLGRVYLAGERSRHRRRRRPPPRPRSAASKVEFPPTSDTTLEREHGRSTGND